MNEISLKYGCNPHQKPARIYSSDALPIEVLNGQPGYINLLDALSAWQLVRELHNATGIPAAASFKHVSPAGAAIGLPLSDILKQIYFVDSSIMLSPIACAYARARGADRMSSFGDFIALSACCDVPTALLIKKEVSDGIIAPDYTPEALEILKAKRKGKYNIIKIDATYTPQEMERKEVFGITFEQRRNDVLLDKSVLNNIPTLSSSLPDTAQRDLLVALITLKYTQSNSVCYAKEGQAIGIGAGQQSRIHCTRLAGDKADIWWLRQLPQVTALPFLPSLGRAERDNAIDVFLSSHSNDVLKEGVWQNYFSVRPTPLTTEEKTAWITQNKGVSLASDAFFPFDDNIERAHRSGVEYIAQPGGSLRDDLVIGACNRYGITMAFTNVRLFHH